MTTKIIITPANHGASKGAGAPLVGRTVRVVTVGAPPSAARPPQNKTLVTVPAQRIGRLASGTVVQAGMAASGRNQVRTVFKRVYSSTAESAPGLTRVYSSGAESPGSQPLMATAPRKRQRLDHLSADQKNQRRKLKNRVAAQTARDRKKVQMDLLESRVSSLERQNDELLQQNTFLQKQNELLSKQNALLLQRLEPAAAPAAAAAAVAPAPTSVESAALISGPQQQGQETGVAHQRRSAAAALLALSLVSWASFQVALATTVVNTLICSTSSAKQYSAVKSRRTEGRRPPALLWWGPQQKSWSPAMIR